MNRLNWIYGSRISFCKVFFYLTSFLHIKNIRNIYILPSRLERQDLQRVPSTQGSDSQPHPLRAVRDRRRHQHHALPRGRQGVQEVPHEPRPLRQHALPLAHVRQRRVTTMLLQVRTTKQTQCMND